MRIMNGLVSERLPLDEIFPEDIMQDSPVYQYIIEKRIGKGTKEYD